MEITVKVVKENKDGSADCMVKFDKKGLECLVQWGLIGILTKVVDEYKVKNKCSKTSIQPVSKKKATKK